MASFSRDLFRHCHRVGVSLTPKNLLPINRIVVAYLHETSVRFQEHATSSKHS